MTLPAISRKGSRLSGSHGIRLFLGLFLDSSVLIAAERRKLTPQLIFETVRNRAGEIPIAICAITVAELGHGIYRATEPDIRDRRRAFLDELKATVPIHPITVATAEIVARIGGEQACRGINLPLGDLLIGACALELGYAIGTSNIRDFARIPGLSVVHL
jgi:tRNA(fMet)-specific endonuclease VapC